MANQSLTIQNSLKEGERLDELHRNGYKIIQDKNRFCFGMDAVLLSGFAQVKQGETVLDLGTGTGIIPILLQVFYRSGNPAGQCRYGAPQRGLQSSGREN